MCAWIVYCSWYLKYRLSLSSLQRLLISGSSWVWLLNLYGRCYHFHLDCCFSCVVMLYFIQRTSRELIYKELDIERITKCRIRIAIDVRRPTPQTTRWLQNFQLLWGLFENIQIPCKEECFFTYFCIRSAELCDINLILLPSDYRRKSKEFCSWSLELCYRRFRL